MVVLTFLSPATPALSCLRNDPNHVRWRCSRHVTSNGPHASDRNPSIPHVHRVAALLKRWLIGTHHAVSREHLDYYLMSIRFDSIDDALVTGESSSTGLYYRPRPLGPRPIQRWSNTYGPLWHIDPPQRRSVHL